MRDYVQSVYNAYGSGPSQPGFLGGNLTRKKGHKKGAKSPKKVTKANKKKETPKKKAQEEQAAPPRSPGKGLATKKVVKAATPKKGAKTPRKLKKNGQPIKFLPGTRALQSGYSLALLIFNAIIYPGSVKSRNSRKARIYWTGTVLAKETVPVPVPPASISKACARGCPGVQSRPQIHFCSNAGNTRSGRGIHGGTV